MCLAMRLGRLLLLLVCGLWNASPLLAQLPFYTDNSDVTDRGTLHFEFFNEVDALQSAQYPNLRQNTFNYKVNYGFPHHLELDFDAPYLSIYRGDGAQTSNGPGDTNMGIKWNFHRASAPLSSPALAASLYFEFPTGNTTAQLGSGLTDYWLNSIVQEPLSDKTRLTANLGFLFAGNTSTGVLGIQTTRGHVFTGGISLVHDVNPRLSLGAEAYGGVADNADLGKDQLQGLAGGVYTFHDGLAVTFALLGGSQIASPRVGGQIGFEVDFPSFLHRAPEHESSFVPLPSPARQRRSP